ncbi:hypothetical protein [Nocardia goodfellowii]|uniref:Glutamate/tyrosine decarboxylase-like PLP-dependent enzyme n=1 Tax=Nocardia goodfellowii TaxID=882446 RepID=A0ABS4Q7J0_9NOCA|nr:hypothetical protein [Nocardia goodfellowii]MBP2187657.1 glutamate/tyrosine decarboxylase-like PLP-dependent enzyme [Nocardia goodfellowii]
MPENSDDLFDRLRTRGWTIAAYPLPADRGDETVMRAVIRHGFPSTWPTWPTC